MINANEEWRVLPAPYEKYEISSLGSCRNLKTGKNLSAAKIGGYLKYTLRISFGSTRQKMLFAHRLVAMAFLPDVFSDCLVVNHKDKNKANNSTNNLECISQRENILHRNQTMNYRVSQKNKPVEQFTLDGQLVQVYFSAHEAARVNAWGQRNISSCARGEKKAAYGFMWAYVNFPDQPNEIWKRINVADKTVEVSNFGRVMSHNQIKTFGSDNGSGYLTVSLNGKKIKVHRLIAEAFCEKPDNFTAEHVVDHINANRSDNGFENLRWAAKSENSEFAKRTKRIKATSSITGAVLYFDSAVEASLATGANRSNISAVCHGRLKSTAGFQFEFWSQE